MQISHLLTIISAVCLALSIILFAISLVFSEKTNLKFDVIHLTLPASLICFYGGLIVNIIGFILSAPGHRTAQLIFMIIYIIIAALFTAAIIILVHMLAAIVKGFTGIGKFFEILSHLP